MTNENETQTWVAKVPEVTLVFWIIKILCTTIGETGGDAFTMSFLGFVDVDSPSYALKPAFKLSGHDHLSVEIAAAIFGGPEGTFGGLPDGADEVSITVQYGL